MRGARRGPPRHAAAGFVELGEVRRRVGDLEGRRRRSGRPRSSADARRRAWPAAPGPGTGRCGQRDHRALEEETWKRLARQAPAGAGADRRGLRRPRRQPAWRPPSSTPSRPSSAGRRCSRPPPRAWSPGPRGGDANAGVRRPAASARALAGPRRAVRGRDGGCCSVRPPAWGDEDGAIASFLAARRSSSSSAPGSTSSHAPAAPQPHPPASPSAKRRSCGSSPPGDRTRTSRRRCS